MAQRVEGVTQTQDTALVKSAVLPQIRVEPQLRAELESVLEQGETLTEFVEASVRNAIAFRRVRREPSQTPNCRAARSFMISSEPPPIIITLTSR